MSTVMESFNTTVRQMIEMAQQKKNSCRMTTKFLEHWFSDRMAKSC